MNELKSYTEYAVSTPTADFVIGFDFNYGEDAVNVTVNDVPASEAGYTVVYLNETTIRLSPSVPSGVVRLQRETDIDQTDHAYRAGAKFIAQTMDENFEQLRYSQQEVRDGFVKLADDTYEIIDTLNEVGQSAQDAADAAEVAATLANNAAAQVNDKVSYADFNTKPHNAMLARDAAAAHPTSSILDTSGETQQQVNYNGGSKWHSRVGGYLENERAVLTNGDIVKSTIDSNTNDPNSDMTGWVNPAAHQRAKNLDSFSFDDVLSQNEINNSRTTDLSVKLQSVFNDPNIKKIIFKRPYYINKLVTFNRDIEWECVGEGELIYGATGKIEGGGTAELIGKLKATANKYTKSLSVPAGISAGDIICIYNPADFSFSPHRDYYRDGQFATVANVVSGVATLYDILYANYPTSCDIYKINRARVTIRNLKFSVNAATNNIPITIKYAKVGVYGLQSKGSDRYGLVLSRCYGVDVVGIDAKQFKSVVDGYQYGIVIANCQDMVLNGGNAAGSRHGVTFGSLGAECGVPNRNVSIINATIMSTSMSAAGADIHGNADNVKYINCTIQHASVGGKNISITDSVVYGRELDGVAVWFGELIGGVVEVKRTKIISKGDGGADFGYIYVGIDKDLREPLFIDVDDITLSALNSTSVSKLLRVVVVNNLQLTKKISIAVNEIKGFDLPALQAILHFQFGSSGSTTKIPVGAVSVDNIRSLPPCAILFTTSDWDAGYDLKLMKQSGSQVINTGNGAQTLVQGALTNFKYRYPVVPNLVMSVSTADSSWNAAFSTTPISPVGSVRSNYVAPAIQSPAAMPTSKNITVGWEVGV